MTKLLTRHEVVGDGVVYSVDLNMKFVTLRMMFVVVLVFLRLLFVAHRSLLLTSRYNDTIQPNYLTIVMPRWTIVRMKSIKAMTIRLTTEQAEALETVASVEDRPISEVIRAAIDEHIDGRKKDPAFQDSLKDRLARARRLLRE